MDAESAAHYNKNLLECGTVVDENPDPVYCMYLVAESGLMYFTLQLTANSRGRAVEMLAESLLINCT